VTLSLSSTLPSRGRVCRDVLAKLHASIRHIGLHWFPPSMAPTEVGTRSKTGETWLASKACWGKSGDRVQKVTRYSSIRWARRWCPVVQRGPAAGHRVYYLYQDEARPNEETNRSGSKDAWLQGAWINQIRESPLSSRSRCLHAAISAGPIFHQPEPDVYKASDSSLFHHTCPFLRHSVQPLTFTCLLVTSISTSP